MAKVAGREIVARLVWFAAAVVAGGCVRASDPTQVARAALTAAPFVGPEVRVDEPVYTDKAGDQRYAFAAVGGPGAIVVWENDTRPGFAATSDLIWFVRLGPDGAPLDRLPIPITPASQAQTQQTPAAGWSGDRALAVWVEDGNQLRGARIGADGRVLDPNGIVIALNAVAYQSKFRILPAGDGWAVFWGTDKDTRVTRVSRDGAVATVSGHIVPMPAMTPALWFADAAPVTGGYIVMFYGGMVAGAIKVDAAGAALSTVTTTSTTATVVEGALGSNGTTAVALWIQSAITAGQPATPMAIMTRRLSDAGAWIDAAASEVRPAGPWVQRLGVTWTGTNFICAWNDGASSRTRVTLAMRRMDPTGTFSDAQPIVPASLAGGLVAAAQVVWMGGAPLVVLQKTIYTTENSGREDVQDGVEARALGADLQPVGAAANPISVQANTQGPYRAVSVGPAALTLWQDDRPRAQLNPDGYGNADVYGARLAIANGQLTQAVMPVATANSEGNPTITWDGTQAPIAYDSFNGTTTRRAFAHLLPSGTSDGKTVATLTSTQALAEIQLLPNATGLIMAGLFYNSSLYSRPYVHRLSAAGAELDAQPIAVSWAMPFSSFHLGSVGGAARWNDAAGLAGHLQPQRLRRRPDRGGRQLRHCRWRFAGGRREDHGERPEPGAPRARDRRHERRGAVDRSRRCELAPDGRALRCDPHAARRRRRGGGRGRCAGAPRSAFDRLDRHVLRCRLGADERRHADLRRVPDGRGSAVPAGHADVQAFHDPRRRQDASDRPGRGRARSDRRGDRAAGAGVDLRGRRAVLPASRQGPHRRPGSPVRATGDHCGDAAAGVRRRRPVGAGCERRRCDRRRDRWRGRK